MQEETFRKVPQLFGLPNGAHCEANNHRYGSLFYIQKEEKKVLFSKLSISNEFSPHEYILNE